MTQKRIRELLKNALNYFNYEEQREQLDDFIREIDITPREFEEILKDEDEVIEFDHLDIIELNTDITFEVSRQDVDDIMRLALEGGINEWCCAAEADGEFLGDYLSEQIGLGGVLILQDADTKQKYKLDLTKFIIGLQMAIEENPQLIDTDSLTLNTCCIDNDAANCIVQLALFGEVLYE